MNRIRKKYFYYEADSFWIGYIYNIYSAYGFDNFFSEKCEPSEKRIVLDDGKFGRCYLGVASYSVCDTYFGSFGGFRIV